MSRLKSLLEPVMPLQVGPTMEERLASMPPDKAEAVRKVLDAGRQYRQSKRDPIAQHERRMEKQAERRRAKILDAVQIME